MSNDSTRPIAARRAPAPLSPAPLVAASPRVQSPTALTHRRPVRPALAAILLFTIFRGGVPFLASSALPAALLRARAPAHARTRAAGAGMSSTNHTAGGSARGLPRVVVEMLPGEDKVNIAVPLAGKPRNLNRPGSEPLAKAMFRLRAAAAPPSKGKKKGGKGFVATGTRAAPAPDGGGETEAAEAAEDELLVCELRCPETGSTVDEGTLNVDAWKHGRVLRVGKEEFVVDLNPPSVSALRLPPRPLVGYPLRASFELQFTTAEECAWKWYRGRFAQEGEEGSSPRVGGRKMVWEPIASDTGPHYVPQEQDVGAHLRVDSWPLGGVEYSVSHAVSDKSVERGPAIKAGQGRHDLTRHPLQGDGVRVVSYNLLASAYTDTTYAKTQLFPYVTDGALDAHYRLQLIVEELLGFHADVLCLQEVDVSAFDQVLGPELACAGLDGLYLNKAGTVKEGEAVFFRRDKWRLAGQKGLSMRQCFAPSSLAPGGLHASLAEFLGRSCNRELARILSSKLTTVAQICCLVPCTTEGAGAQKGLVVVNTHLFFHPGAAHIRMLLVSAILREVQAARQKWEGETGLPLAVILAGDLNSEPDTGAIELLGSGQVSAQHQEWVAAASFAWGDTDADAEGLEVLYHLLSLLDLRCLRQGPCLPQGVEPELAALPPTEGGGCTAGELERQASAEEAGQGHGVDLSHDLALASSDGLETSFTNYVRGYIGCLDYIFYEEERLGVRQLVPLPREEEVAVTALPSQRFPSDHLSLCCDFEWLVPSAAHTTADQQKSAAPGRYPGRLGSRKKLPQPASPHLVYKGVTALRKGHVIALPTDTVYGLAAAADSAEGVARLYQIKGRSSRKAIAVCVAEVEDIQRYGDTAGLPEGLLQKLLPGPITIVLKRLKSAPVCKSLTADLDTLALRVPGPDVWGMWKRPSGQGLSFCRAIASSVGAIALTSANPSNSSSSLSPQEFRPLWEQLAYVFDGGTLGDDKRGSTIIDLTRASSDGVFDILRSGIGLPHALETMSSFGLVQSSSSQIK